MSKSLIVQKFIENIKELIEKGQVNDAKELLYEYKKISPDDLEIYSILGVIDIMENKLDEAEKVLLNGLSKDNSNFDLLFNLGYLYEIKSDKANAFKYYKLANDNARTQAQKEDTISSLEKIKPIEIPIKEKGNNVVKDIEEYYNRKIDKEIKKLFKNKNYEKILETVQIKITNRNYDEVITICNYWLNKIDSKTGIIHYFMGVAANGIRDFKNAIKYHERALELDNSLADLRHRKSKYQYSYKEKRTSCIGCDNEIHEIINVSNQSISEDNKGLINPIRVWVKCEKCKLIYANPLPVEESLNQYYSIIAKEKFGGIYGNIDNKFEFLINMANSRLEKIEQYIGGCKTILDIGTGIGIFTGTALDRGWKAEGLEFTPEDCEYAKEKFDLELKKENFYNFKGDRQYDVVTLFEVIEHLYNPLRDLKQINKLVKDNGLLVIATPIQDSMYGRKMKEKNVFWNVVTHLSYFTKDVMIDYLEQAGFKVIEINGSKEGMGRMEFYCRKIQSY